jgi:hypothetical protein
MDRADHVVEVARRQQVVHPVLSARDEVGLDAEPQVGLLAHEAAVLVDVVGGVCHPEGMPPDRERLLEAVDVLRDAKLVDALLGGDGTVTVGVLGSEVPLGGGALAVRAQMDVVVAQHDCDSIMRRFNRPGAWQAVRLPAPGPAAW